ncbi:hypothetical protein SDC9_117428 [bioreactor metagenome]|uniref:Uncharacterized protein n=1 Tax=bioreactor metagenome TaxID=1076179 RepID=A0A645C549_9ZZZZ
MVCKPRSWHARNTRMAISPRLATSTFLNSLLMVFLPFPAFHTRDRFCALKIPRILHAAADFYLSQYTPAQSSLQRKFTNFPQFRKRNSFCVIFSRVSGNFYNTVQASIFFRTPRPFWRARRPSLFAYLMDLLSTSSLSCAVNASRLMTPRSPSAR